jgi:hypothetical protein
MSLTPGSADRVGLAKGGTPAAHATATLQAPSRAASVTAVASSSGSAPASSASAEVLTPSRAEASARCSARPSLFSARWAWSNSLAWSSSVRIE